MEVGKTIAMTVEIMTANEVYENDNGEIVTLDVARVEKLVNSECRWSSSSELIAKVDENGNVTGVSEGTATITAVYNESGKDYSNELEINVKAAAQSDEPSNAEPSNDEPATPVKPDPPQEKPVNTGSDMTVVAVLAVVAAFSAVVISGTKLMKKKGNA